MKKIIDNLFSVIILLLASEVGCWCLCRMDTIDLEYIAQDGRFRLLHPHVCISETAPVVERNNVFQMLSAGISEQCCCRAFWRNERVFQGGSTLFMKTAFYCQNITCPY